MSSDASVARFVRVALNWPVTMNVPSLKVIAFSFSNGEPGRMTRGEMLLHVALHGAGHRGQVALLLQKNGIQPWPDRITDFLGAEYGGPQQQGPLAEVTS